MTQEPPQSWPTGSGDPDPVPLDPWDVVDPLSGKPVAPDPTLTYPAPYGAPAQSHPAQSHPAQPHPAQSYPAQSYPAQAYPPYAGQPSSGQAYPAPYPGRPTPGQPLPGQPYPPPVYAPGPYPQYPSPYGGVPAAPTNGMAIASLVLGVLWLFWIGSVLAVIFGHVARNQIARTGEGGGGLALAGLILGWIGVGVFVLGILAGIVENV